MLPIVHWRPTDGSITHYSLQTGREKQRVSTQPRPTHGSNRGQRMVQVTLVFSLVSALVLLGGKSGAAGSPEFRIRPLCVGTIRISASGFNEWHLKLFLGGPAESKGAKRAVAPG